MKSRIFQAHRQFGFECPHHSMAYHRDYQNLSEYHSDYYFCISLVARYVRAAVGSLCVMFIFWFVYALYIFIVCICQYSSIPLIYVYVHIRTVKCSKQHMRCVSASSAICEKIAATDMYVHTLILFFWLIRISGIFL